MKMKLALMSVALAMICSGNSHAAGDDTSSKQLTDAEKTFLDAAAAGDMGEIELSKIAATKSTTSAVRGFAQQMVDDHATNYQTLRTLADNKGYAIAPQLDERHKSLILKLQSQTGGAALDQAYLDAMIADHSDMNSVLERMSGNANDSEITRFAADTLATVKKHEQMAKDLANK